MLATAPTYKRLVDALYTEAEENGAEQQYAAVFEIQPDFTWKSLFTVSLDDGYTLSEASDLLRLADTRRMLGFLDVITGSIHLVAKKET